jgi:hypothetical protein
MSERRSKLPAQIFEIVPVKPRQPQNRRWLLLGAGVIYPAAVIVFELSTRFCAQALFDPMPTPWHALAVSFAPACNLLIWLRLYSGKNVGSKWLAACSGAAIAIGGFYALLFAPLLPLAILAIMLYGIGLLPLAPIAAFCGALLLRRSFVKAAVSHSHARHFWGGLAAGLALLLVLDVTPTATRYGLQLATSSEQQESQRGLWLLRHLSDENLLLRLCYDTSAKPAGLISWIYYLNSRSVFASNALPLSYSVADAREVYYRVYGVAFNSRPTPVITRRNPQLFWGRFDNDLGGVDVGSRIEGLDLASSRIDGVIHADDAVAYLEWTFEFKNRSNQDREARLQLALPPKGVVSRATLWVDGVEREAAYTGRNEARAAYQSVVRQARDPLLVTAKGPDRILAQAFPVARNGGSIKFKIGITAPLELTGGGKARLVLPQIVERNFDLGEKAAHALWIESKHSLSSTAPGLAARDVAGGAFRIEGEIADRTLTESRKTIDVAWEPSSTPVASRIGDGEIVEQAFERETLAPPSAIMIVVDGSARTGPAVPGLLAALDALPANAKAGLMIAGNDTRELPVGPWTEEQKNAARKVLQTADFIGGQDNTAALAEAFNRLEPYENALVLWVHGPQPVRFSKGLAALDRITRLQRLPKLVLYDLEPGPNEALPDAPWAWSASVLPQIGTPDSDLSAFFRKLELREELRAVRKVVTEGKGEKKGSDHIARLWASEQALWLLASHKADGRSEAVALASRYRLVTAVSGAVVLQTAQQYAQNDLTPVAPGTVPAVPEPEEWALILMVCAVMSWLMLRRGLCAGRIA